MVTLHEVITFLVSMQISISSLQTHNVNRCGRSRHLARKLSLRRKRSRDRKSGSAGMPRPISYAVFCLKKKIKAAGVHWYYGAYSDSGCCCFTELYEAEAPNFSGLSQCFSVA